jgi:hypothetical protein
LPEDALVWYKIAVDHTRKDPPVQADRLSIRVHLLHVYTIVGILLTGLGLALFLSGSMRLAAVPSDFSQDYFAALALRHNRSIYSDFSTLPAIDESSSRLAGVSNYHPPFNVVLFLPLTFMPYAAAVALWSLLSLVLYAAAGWIILRELGLGASINVWLIIGLALCWDPFISHIALGQLSLLLVGCIIGAWSCLRHNHDSWAGFLIGWASLIKLFPGLLIVYLLLKRRWIAGAAAILTFVLGYAMTVAVVGFDDTLRYHREVMIDNVAAFGPFVLNVSMTGVFQRMFTDGQWVQPLAVQPQMASLAVAGVSLVLLLPLAFRHYSISREADDESFALACVAMLLIAPVMWSHIFPLLWLPFGLLYRRWQELKERQVARLSLLALILLSLPNLAIARALMDRYAPYRMPWHTSLLLLGPTLGLLILWWLLWKRPGQAPAASKDHCVGAV